MSQASVAVGKPRVMKNRIRKSTFALFLMVLMSCSTLLVADVKATDPDAEGWPFSDLIPPYSRKIPVPVGEDGTSAELATLVYYNQVFDINQRAATLMVRSPYDISNTASDLVGWNYANTYGLFTVTQDMRGRYHSTGKDTLFGDDYQDGKATVDWLKGAYGDVWWWNGKLGTWGSSALCINQYTYAGENIPELRMQYLGVGSPEQYDHVFFQGGEFRYDMIMSWTSAQGAYSNWYAQNVINAHPKFDSWWDHRSLAKNDRYANVHASAVHFGGWDDPFSEGTVTGFMGYNYQGASDARNHQILVMGGIGHGAPVGDIAWPHATEVPVNNLEDWIIRTELLEQYGTRGSPSYEAAWAAMNKTYYYVYADPAYDGIDPKACSWRIGNDWPVPATEERWYLNPGSGQWAGVLDRNGPPLSEQVESYNYDPNNYCPTNGGDNLYDTAYTGSGFQAKFGSDKTGQGSTDQRGGANGLQPVTGRFDVLEFDTPVFTAPYEMIGNINAKLYVRSTGQDTDFVAKLCDVFPDGRVMLITDGLMRAVRRNGYDTTNWMSGNLGDTYEIPINLWSTAWRVEPGHKLKLIVTSSNYPRFQRNPNLPQEVIPIDFGSNYIAVQNRIVMAPNYPSYVELPVTEGAYTPVQSVNITSPADGYYTEASSVPITWTVSTPVRNTTVYLNDVPQATVNVPQTTYTVTGLSTGANTIKVIGNTWFGPTPPDSITVNSAPHPSVQITAPTDNYETIVDSVNLSWTQSAYIPSVDIFLNNNLLYADESGSSKIITGFTAGMWNNLTVVGQDQWNQVSQDTVWINYTLPPSPLITITSPPDSSTITTSSVLVTWQNSAYIDNVSLYLNNIYQDLVQESTTSYLFNNLVDEAWNTIKLTGTDIWGVNDTKTIQVYYSSTLPDVNLTAPAWWFNTSTQPLTITWTESPFVEEVSIFLNGGLKGTVPGNTKQFQLSGLALGNNSLFITGNKSNAVVNDTDTRNFYYQPHPAIYSLLPAGGIHLTVPSVEVTWNSSESVNHVEIRLNGNVKQEFSNCEGSFNLEDLSTGTNVIELRVSDQWGQIAIQTASISYAPVPSVPLTFPYDGLKWEKSEITIVWTPNPNLEKVEIYLNGVLMATLTNTKTSFTISNLPNGTMTLRIEATDIYGVTGTTQVTFQVNLPPPPNWVEIILIIGILAGGTAGASIYVKRRRDRDVKSVLEIFKQPTAPPPLIEKPRPQGAIIASHPKPDQPPAQKVPVPTSIRPAQTTPKTVITIPSQIAPTNAPKTQDSLQNTPSQTQGAIPTRTCASCKAPLPPNAKWCNKCGAKVSQTLSISEEHKQ